MLNVFMVGDDRPTLLRIPPFVIHGVQNIGSEAASFINLPTKAWNPHTPDRCRLPQRDPRKPFGFDDREPFLSVLRLHLAKDARPRKTVLE